MRAVLRDRHLVDNAECPWCSKEDKTVLHGLFLCERWHSTWEEMGCRAMIGGEEDETMCDMVERWSSLDAKMVQRGGFLAWNIWGARNQLVFEGKSQPVSIMVQRVGKQCEEYNSYATRIYGGPKGVGSVSAPPAGSIKLNTDAYLGEEGWIGLGVVAPDSQGKVRFAAVRRTGILAGCCGRVQSHLHGCSIG